jgi:predicted flap endonuclease-1-like 5' DNA nuclease
MKPPKFLTGLLLGTLLAAAFWYWQKSTSAEDGALEVLDRLAAAEARLREQMAVRQEEMGDPVQADPDDLRAIDGIGPTYAQRLREAGIVTFAGLAALTPERVMEITGSRSVETAVDWIVAAEALSAP